MNAKLPTSGMKAAAAAAFLVTAVLGWNLAERPAVPEAAAPAPAGVGSKASKRTERGTGRYGTPGHVREAMKRIREAGSTEARMRATIELAGSLPASEIGEWLDGRWFDTGDGFDLTLFNKILKQRWREEDPESLLLWAFKNGPETSRAILTDWAAHDPQRLIEFYRNHPNDAMELQSLSEMAKSDPALVIGRLQEMIARGIPANASGYDQHLLSNLAAKSPAALEAALGSLPPAWQDKAELALVAERLKTSFDEEIRKLWERPDGWKLFEKSMRTTRIEDMGEKLLKGLADLPASWRSSLASNPSRFLNSNPASAEKWLEADLEGGGFTAEQASTIRIQALQNMSYEKPEAVLSHLAGMEIADERRQSLIRNVFANAAREPAKVETLMGLLENEADREAAQGAVAALSLGGGGSVPEVRDPGDWLAKAGEIDPNSGSGYQFMSMLENWDRGKIADLAGQFRTMPDENKRKIATLLSGNSFGMNELDPGLQGEAIRYLVANPAEKAAGDQGGREARDEQLASFHAVRGGQGSGRGQRVGAIPAGGRRAALGAEKSGEELGAVRSRRGRSMGGKPPRRYPQGCGGVHEEVAGRRGRKIR
jgi:hypothetical protein